MANGNEEIKFNSTLIRLIVTVALCVAAVTGSWAVAREYTNEAVKELRTEILTTMNTMDNKLDTLSENVGVLIDRYER